MATGFICDYDWSPTRPGLRMGAPHKPGDRLIAMSTPDRATLERWLEDARVQFELCGHCEGLHLVDLRLLEGVVDSRLLVESFGILLTTGLEVRPMALMAVAADLGRLSMDYPVLKLFLDIVDDATPQLVVSVIYPGAAGMSQAQFTDFLAAALQATRELATECLRLDYLFAGDNLAPEDVPASRLH